jgi:RNA polymerase sigma-70 factor (ECF subfamily)
MPQRPLSAVPGGDDESPPAACAAPRAAAATPRGAHRGPGRAEELLRRTALGESEAFDELYTLFASRVYGIARRVVRDPDQAEEVAQEVFLEVWRRASRFDQTRGSATAWVMALAHSRAVDRVRSAQAATDREVRAGRAAVERDIDSTTEAVEHRWERAAVRHCLSTLTELQRQSVTMAYYSGYTYPEVATLLGTPLPTVKTRMRDGLIRLRDCLGVSR